MRLGADCKVIFPLKKDFFVVVWIAANFRMKTFCLSPSWRHNIRPNDTLYYDTYQDDTEHNEGGYNETQHGNEKCDTA